METNIKYNELKDISSFIVTKNEELGVVLKKIEEIIDSVNSAWQGKDCVEFVKEAKEYISSEEEKRNKLTKFASCLDTISNDFIELENNWSNQIKRENLENE